MGKFEGYMSQNDLDKLSKEGDRAAKKLQSRIDRYEKWQRIKDKFSAWFS